MDFERQMCFDRDVQPITYERWAELHADPGYVRVAGTHVMDLSNPKSSFHISTVWLGLNHNYFDETPIIFETMIFTDDETHELAYEGMRNATEQDALVSHKQVVDYVAGLLKDPLIMDPPMIGQDAGLEVSFGETSCGPVPNALPPNSSESGNVNTPPSGSPASDPVPE